MTRPILCLDFDGVIHSYESGWRGVNIIPDPPVPGAIEFLKEATGEFDVCIYSSRSSSREGKQAMQVWLHTCVQEKYGMLPFWLDHIYFPDHKPPALVTLDDRALCFEGTWPDIDDLLNFKPWYKRDPAQRSDLQHTLLDFCRNCGILLPPREELKHDACPNCGKNVAAREGRVTGLFANSEARLLIDAWGGEG